MPVKNFAGLTRCLKGVGSLETLRSPDLRQKMVRAATEVIQAQIRSGNLLGWIARLSQMAFQVFMVRLIMETLGSTLYAGVVLLFGLGGWLGNADLGFSTGLLNVVSVAKAKGNDGGPLKVFGALCYLVLSGLGIAICLLVTPFVANSFLAAIPIIDRSAVMSTSLVAALLVGTGAIGNRLLFAEQRINLYYLLSLAATGGSAGLFVLMWLRVLPIRIDVVVLVTYLPQAAIGLVGLFICLRGAKLTLPAFQDMIEVVVVSLKFLGLNFLTLMTVQTDTFVISQRLSAHDISVYGIYTKLFSAMNLLIVTPLGILWPRFSVHAARGEWRPMRVLIETFLAASLGIMCLWGLFVYFFGGWIVHILAPGQHIVAPPNFILLLTLLQLSILWTGSFHTACISMSVLTPALLLTPLQAALSFAAQWVLAKRFGIVGVTEGLLLSYVVMAVWVSPLVLWIVVRRRRAAAGEFRAA